MPRSLRWTLLFTEACLEHLEERGIGAEDVANAVFGIHGRVRVRRIGRDDRERWFVVGQIDGGQLLTCVFRAARARDLEMEGAFTIPRSRVASASEEGAASMKLCVSARLSDSDEVRSYLAWRSRKG